MHNPKKLRKKLPNQKRSKVRRNLNWCGCCFNGFKVTPHGENLLEFLTNQIKGGIYL